MRRILTLVLLAAAAVCMTGCLYASQNTQRYTINPDGTGKCRMEFTVDVASAHWMNIPSLDGKEIAEMIAGGCVTGADAWSDVSYQVDKDKQLHFKGTAYFKDLAEFRILPMIGGGSLQMRWRDMRDQGNGGGALVMNTSPPRLAGPLAPVPVMPEADKKIAMLRANWEQLKNELVGGLAASDGNTRVSISYEVPGNADEVTGFERVRAFMGPDIGMVTLNYDYKKLLPAVDKLMKDDQAMRDAVSNGHFPGDNLVSLPDQTLLATAVLGKPLAAKVGPNLKPRFDYAKEVAAAWAAEPAMFAKLEMPGLPVPRMTFTDGDTNITVGLRFDGRTLIARDAPGKELWTTDVFKAAGEPMAGKAVVTTITIANGQVNAMYGRSVAAFDLKTGKFLGAMSN